MLKTGCFTFVAGAVAFVVLALSVLSFAGAAFADEPAIIRQQSSRLSAECNGSGLQKNVRFLDNNGDGLNDLLQDSDGDGIPDGRMCNGSGAGAGRGAFFQQGEGGMIHGAGRGFGNGFGQGRGRR